MDRERLLSLRTPLAPASIMTVDRVSYTEVTRLVPAPPTEAKPPGRRPNRHRGVRLPRSAVAEEADGQEAWFTAAHSNTGEVADPDHHRGVRLPPLVAPAAGADDQIVRRPAEAKLPDYKPPGEKVVYFSVLQI